MAIVEVAAIRPTADHLCEFCGTDVVPTDIGTWLHRVETPARSGGHYVTVSDSCPDGVVRPSSVTVARHPASSHRGIITLASLFD